MSQATTTLFSLPKILRKKIYEEVLSIKHPLYIFQDSGSPLELFAPDRPREWLALLHTNRQISRESSLVLYAVNNFVFQGTDQGQTCQLENFLGCIGLTNAGAVAHLCINFPVIETQGEDFKLSPHSLRRMCLLQDRCHSLAQLEVSVNREHFESLTSLDHNNPQLLQKALACFDSEFKAMKSLPRMTIRFHYGQPSSSLIEAMQEFEWSALPWDKDRW